MGEKEDVVRLWLAECVELCDDEFIPYFHLRDSLVKFAEDRGVPIHFREVKALISSCTHFKLWKHMGYPGGRLKSPPVYIPPETVLYQEWVGKKRRRGVKL